MSDIFFTHSYFLRFDPKQWATGQPYAPLGTLYAAAYMRSHGYPVSFFDTMFAKGPQELAPRLHASPPGIFVIYDDGFNYLTKMCLENMRNAAFEMIRLAKATYRKMVQNLAWATGYNGIAMPLAAGVLYSFGILLSPAMGAVLMSVSTVVVAINARLLKIER